MQITENSPRLKTLVKIVSEYAKRGFTPPANLIVQVVNEYAKKGFTLPVNLIVQVVNEGLSSLEGDFSRSILFIDEPLEEIALNEGILYDVHTTQNFIEIINDAFGIEEFYNKRILHKRERSFKKTKGGFDMIRLTTSGKFLSSDLSLNAGQTKEDGTDFTSNVFYLEDAIFSSITLKVIGANAGSSGKVTFNFVSYNEALDAWDTTPFSTLEADLDGTNTVVITSSFNPDINKIKLASVVNGDSTYGASVNAGIFIKK